MREIHTLCSTKTSMGTEG